jgi:hypothetical protein
MTFSSERPLRRSLWKLAAQLVYGKRRAHAHNWLPSLGLAGMPGDAGGCSVTYRGKPVAQLSGIAALAERAGATIHIIGSGPSVAGNDLTRIGDDEAILLNGAISLIGAPIARPLAVAIEDERFVWRHFQLMRDKIAPSTLCLLSLGVMRALCEIEPLWLKGRTIVLIDDIRKPYAGDRRKLEQLRDLAFAVLSADGAAGLSLQPERGVFQGGSVAVSALQFALACKPKTLGLIGIDIANADQPRFYETTGQMAQSGIAGAEDRILRYFELARSVGAQNGTALVNLSPISALAKLGLAYDDRFAAGVSSRS